MNPDCVFCENKSLFRCQQCKVTYYCSPECQSLDWKRHEHEHRLDENHLNLISVFESVTKTFTPLLRIKHTGDEQMGFGFFARQDICAGGLIFLEKAETVAPIKTICSKMVKEKDPVKRFQHWCLSHDKTLESEFKRAESIILRNGVTDSVHHLKNENPVYALFFLFSRFNHSCSPNTYMKYHTNDCAIALYAARDIKKGEEVTVYLHFAYFLERQDRDVLFNLRFGEKCKCVLCKDESLHPLVDRSMTDLINVVFENLRSEKKLHAYFDQQETFGTLSFVLFFRHVVQLVDIFHDPGSKNPQEVPFSPFRKLIYKNFIPYLSTYPRFKEIAEDEIAKTKFNNILSESILYFKTFLLLPEVEKLKTYFY